MTRTATQLAVFLENRPGVLAEICETLARAGVDIEALTVVDSVDHAVVRFLVDRPGIAVHLLEARGLLVITHDVLTVSLPHRPGSLGALARRLAKARVNIEYLYATTTPGAKKATVVLRPGDVAKARRVLGRG